MLRLYLRHIDDLDELIAALHEQLDITLTPFAADLARLTTITGVGVATARILIAEIGVDMCVFPTAARILPHGAGCAGNNESAWKRRTGLNPTPGWPPPWCRQRGLRPARRTRGCPHAVGGWPGGSARTRPRSAVGHSIVIALWHLHTQRCNYVDLGVGWWDKLTDAGHETERHTRRPEALGHQVTLTAVVS